MSCRYALRLLLQCLPSPKQGLAFLACSALLIAPLSGCSQRGQTKPRSLLIEEAKRTGVKISAPEEDRAEFLAYEKEQNDRLMNLVRGRVNTRVKDANYRIGSGDEIEINVFDVPELNTTVRVRESEFINLPLLGAVKAANRTETELHSDLVQRLRSFVRNPQVNVYISNYGSQKVSVIGALRKPGTFALKKGMNSLIELISEAGGLSEKSGNFLSFVPAEATGLKSADDSEARAQLALSPKGDSLVSDQGVEIYLDQVLGTSGGIPIEVPVRGGDMIIVPEAGKVMVEGEVQKPGPVDLTPQLTLVGALAGSGGLTFGAKLDEVEVVREPKVGKKLRYIVDLEKVANGEERDIRLRTGDIVRVPSHSGRRFRQDTFESIQRLVSFGVGGSVNLK